MAAMRSSSYLVDTHCSAVAVAREFGAFDFHFVPATMPKTRRSRSRRRKPEQEQEPVVGTPAPPRYPLAAAVSVASEPENWIANLRQCAMQPGRLFPVFGAHPLYCTPERFTPQARRLLRCLVGGDPDSAGGQDGAAPVAALKPSLSSEGDFEDGEWETDPDFENGVSEAAARRGAFFDYGGAAERANRLGKLRDEVLRSGAGGLNGEQKNTAAGTDDGGDGGDDEEEESLRAEVLRSRGLGVRAVAVGEAGLDFHEWPSEYGYAARDVQIPVFVEQMKLAVEVGLPLVIHTREAEEETLQLMREHLPREHPIHVHCFTDSVEFMHSLCRGWPNCYIGFAGVVTFAKGSETVRQAAVECPADRLLLESDAPFMAPVPFRGSPCHPVMVSSTAECVAELREVDATQLVQQTHENCQRLFGIPA